MANRRYIHLSDIHFGQEKFGDLVIHDDVRQELLNDCKMLYKSLGTADGLLVTGDVAFNGQPEQYENAGNWLESLTDIVKCPQTSVYVIPGNHDIDRTKISGLCKILHDNLRTTDIDHLDGMWDTLIREQPTDNPLLSKLGAYRIFASRYGCDFFSPTKPLWVKKIELADSNKLSIVGMTSVVVSDEHDGKNNMILGSQQYIFNRESYTEFIVMVHHPIEWFRDYDKVKTYLKRARIVIAGHEHTFGIQKIISEDGSETLWIHSGATNPPGNEGAYVYRYNWIEIAHILKDQKPMLQVKIYPRVWDYENTRFIADRLRSSDGKEFQLYELACPNFDASLDASHEGKEVQTIVVPMTPQYTEGEAEVTVTDDEGPFVRLRYLFWKYLSWDDRLKVLVKLDIIPTTLNQPIPQIMERLALENAKKQGKLKVLWDEIMIYLPDEKKELNPF